MAQRLSAVLVALVLGTAGCGSSQPAVTVPAPTSPLPTGGLAGQQVTVYPMTLVVAVETLGWSDEMSPRREALDRADSIIRALLLERSPEVTWILPAQLLRASRRAPGMLADPYRMGTALLRTPGLSQVPDPLRSQMRTLNGVAGGRFALVPASLVFVEGPDSTDLGEAQLTLVLTDVRTGRLVWRTVARAAATDPWTALREAFKRLTPGLP